MNKLIASASMAALGVAGVQAAAAPGYVPTDKPFVLSTSIRGFYDDNYNTASDDGDKEHSWGYELNPSLAVGISNDQTSFGGRFSFSRAYYEARPKNKSDYTYEFDAWLTHAFSERYSVEVADAFVSAQEPTLVDPSLGTVTRTKNNNIRNEAEAKLNIEMTRLLALEIGYNNKVIFYANDNGTAANPSLAGLLDRMDQLAHIDLEWKALPDLTPLVGYQFGLVNFTGDEPIGTTASGSTIKSDDRNARSQYGYVGAHYNFRQDLVGTVKAGVQYVDYYNDPGNSSDTGPWAELNLQYTYLPESFVEFGFTHKRNQTDEISVKGDDITTDQASSTVYGSITHRILPKLSGTVSGLFQNSVYNGGDFDGDSDNIYMVGVNLTYQFNRHFALSTDYKYDKIDSDISGRGYDRNRVFFGLTTTY